MDMTSSEHHEVGGIECRRLLAGTLFTHERLLKLTLIQTEGPSYTLSPFKVESQSTAYCSRVALLKKDSDIVAIKSLLTSAMPTCEIHSKIKDNLSDDLSVDNTILLCAE